MHSQKYFWIITKDHIHTAENNSILTTNIGVTGGDVSARIYGNRAVFALYNKDFECYYEGIIYGEYEGDEPLEEFGRPECTTISIFVTNPDNNDPAKHKNL